MFLNSCFSILNYFFETFCKWILLNFTHPLVIFMGRSCNPMQWIFTYIRYKTVWASTAAKFVLFFDWHRISLWFSFVEICSQELRISFRAYMTQHNAKTRFKFLRVLFMYQILRISRELIRFQCRVETSGLSCVFRHS